MIDRLGAMNLEVIGPGCRFCNKLHDFVNQFDAEQGIDAEVTYITELTQVIRYVPFTPILKINGEVEHRGKFLPSKEKLAALIKEKSQ